MEWDREAAFDEDYLYFYEEGLSDERSDEEAEVVWRLLELRPGAELLDLACGHGRIANRLAARGASVTGLDATPLFLELARADAASQGVEVEYVEGDMRELPWEERFDAVVSWFTSFGYFDDEGNRRVLAESAKALKSGGRLLVDVHNGFALARNWLPFTVTERDGDLLVDRHRFEVLSGTLVTDRFVVRGGRVRRADHRVRCFTFTELRDWLLAAGFARVDAFDRGGEELTSESRRMLVIATR